MVCLKKIFSGTFSFMDIVINHLIQCLTIVSPTNGHSKFRFSYLTQLKIAPQNMMILQKKVNL